MKKIPYMILGLLILVSIAVAGQLNPYPFPFIGRWQPSADPLLIDDYGYQDIQNVRKIGKAFRGVSGHTKINTVVWNSTNSYPRNGFHFEKDRPSESHIIITAVNSSKANPKLYRNTTAVPGAGSFSSTVLYTEDTGADIGRFSMAPQGNMVYCNGAETLIWGGNELVIAGFEVYDPDGSFKYDYYNEVRNTLDDSDNIAVITPTDAAIDTYTKLLLHFDGSDAGTVFTDDGDTGHTITPIADAQLDTSYQKFGTASGLFDGTGDHLELDDHADWNVLGAAFVIDAWIKLDTLQDSCIVSHTTNDPNFWEFHVSADGALEFLYTDNSALAVEISTSDDTIAAGTEYHVALQRDDSDNFTLWVDGVLQATVNDSSEIEDMTGVFHVGILDHETPTHIFDGWIDELRFTKGIVRYTGGNFEPAITAYSGTGIAYLHIGSVRPIQGFKVYVKTANTATSTMAVYYWNATEWVSVSNLVDNTDTGASLAQTGTVTFDSTVETANKKIISLLELYWYKVLISDCDSTTTVSYVTLDAPMQEVTNIWDTTLSVTSTCYVYTTEYNDYTDEIQDESSDYYADLSSLSTAQYVLFGYIGRQQGFDIRMVAGETNGTNAVLTISYWNGSEWTAIGNLDDGTSGDGKSLGKSGVITFPPVSKVSEFQREIEQELPLHWYKLTWSANLDSSTQIYHVKGIPVQDKIKGYKFPAIFQTRTWLFCEDSNDKSKALYSAYNSPYIFNGSDSGFLYFGDDSEITATAVIYNLYRTSGLEQLIVAKRHQTFRLFGDGPENFEIQQLSSNVGCIAPLSMVVCPLSNVEEENLNRQVVVFQSSSGVVMSDGASVTDISSDIRNYWDPNHSDYIPASRQGSSVAWYDPNIESYKLLISSGSGETTLNVELEYSMKYGEWTKIYRENGSGANPIQVGFIARDTTGNSYSYGANNSGYMYRLENGNSWDGTAISQYLWTKDFLLDIGDRGRPFFSHTIIRLFRLLYKTKTGTGTLAIAHYCDGTLTVDGTDNQAVPDAIDITSGNRSTQDCALGPCLKHSIKLSTSTSNIADGLELLGMGFYYEPIETIQE